MQQSLNYKISNFDKDFFDFFYKIANNRHAFLFSSEDFYVIALNPVKMLTITANKSTVLSHNSSINLNYNPWQNIDDFVNEYNFNNCEYPVNTLGALGFISYPMLHFLEKVKPSKSVNYKMPLAKLSIYNTYLIYDKNTKKQFEVNIEFNKKPIDILIKSGAENYSISDIKSCSTKSEYINKVNKIKHHILNGRVYEVNLTRQLHASFKGNSLAMFKHIFSKNPANYSAFANYGGFSIVCNSPEMFVKLNNGIALSKPIKGTSPRYKNKIDDEKSLQNLLNSKKDEAELFMIIDLLRNDLAKVSIPKGVQVVNPKNVVKVKNVWHLEGIIKAKLKQNISSIKLIKACFPGGSITGCPKVESMQVINELEKYCRNLYTGTILMANKNYLQSNIVIRTAVIVNDEKMYINAGGAVTIDSDANSEYLETVDKLSNFFK